MTGPNGNVVAPRQSAQPAGRRLSSLPARKRHSPVAAISCQDPLHPKFGYGQVSFRFDQHLPIEKDDRLRGRVYGQVSDKPKRERTARRSGEGGCSVLKVAPLVSCESKLSVWAAMPLNVVSSVFEVVASKEIRDIGPVTADAFTQVFIEDSCKCRRTSAVCRD